MRPAVFMDRDGTLIHDRNYLADPKGVRLIAGAAEAIRRIRGLGWAVVVVSNQSGVARGLMTEAQVRQVNAAVERALARHRTAVDAIVYCPHHPDFGEPPYRQRCECRKPAPGMALTAAASLGLDLARSIVVGDKGDDLELGRRLGIPFYLVLTGEGRRSLDLPVAREASGILPSVAALAAVLEQKSGGEKASPSSPPPGR